MAIYVTGDTHGELSINRLSNKSLKRRGIKLTSDDYVIICGDFGFPWKITGENKETSEDKYWLDWLNSKEHTTLYVDGNHENHDYLNSLTIELWKNGKIHRLRDKVIHLMRGEIFNIDNKTIFTFGGAKSIDKHQRTDGVSWWKEEEATYAEMQYGIDNLERYNNEVDYIITHTPPELVIKDTYKSGINCSVARYLDEIYDRIQYTQWYCGHLHLDQNIVGKNINLVYNDVLKIK